jgi:hypothetical protein
MWSEWRCVRKTFVTSAGLIAILAMPVVRLRPASKSSRSEPASMSVLMPSRWASNVGPPWVPSKTTRMLELPPDGRACCDPTQGAATNRMRSRDAVFTSTSRSAIRTATRCSRRAICYFTAGLETSTCGPTDAHSLDWSVDTTCRLRMGSVGRFWRAEPSTPHCDNVIFRMKS